MKKNIKSILSLVLSGVICFGIAGCNGDKEVSSSSSSSTEKIEVDKNITTVEIQMPASMFGESTQEEIIENAKQQEIEAIPNEDGSYTYKMSKAKHQELLSDMKNSVDESIKELVNDEESSFKEITYNKDLTSFDIKVDKAAYENSFDGFSIIGLYIGTSFYKTMEGKANDDMKITMNLIDASNNETFHTAVYPDDLNNWVK